MTIQVSFIVLMALLGANLPFINQRFLACLPLRVIGITDTEKKLPLRLLEWVFLYFLLGLLTRWLELRRGSLYPQNWEFYAITFCIFVVMAYPGFVWSYLRRRRVS